jgi:SAM-dependent methyltransferase
MMAQIQGVETRVQQDPLRRPYEDGRFDFVTAVCVDHHVPLAGRAQLTSEVRRVLLPGGTFCIIEHSPSSPATRTIVSPRSANPRFPQIPQSQLFFIGNKRLPRFFANAG